MIDYGIPTLRVDSWETLATSYRESSLGSASIERSKYRRGVYLMEGVLGYPIFSIEKPIDVTSLKIDGKTWMIDDPLHWIGMREIARECAGRTLVVGLGLALILYHLEENAKVTSITCVERNRDVRHLVTRQRAFRDSIKRAWVIDEDFWSMKGLDAYETIVIDIWTSDVHDGRLVAYEMKRAIARVRTEALPHTKLFIWGTRDRELNPALYPLDERSFNFMTSIANAQRRSGE